MTNKTLDALRAELDQWRARVDHLRVQANLGGKEARDKLRELETTLEPAFDQARRRLDQLAAGGAEEAGTLIKSLRAGWDEVRRTYRDLSREQRREQRESNPPAHK